MRLAPVAALATAALAATAFAPAPTGSSTAAIGGFTPFEETVDGVEVYESYDTADDKPTVLIVGDEEWAEAHLDVLSDGGRYGAALVDLGCGDVGGPADVAALQAVTAYVAGQRTDDDGGRWRGNGDVLLLGVGVGGLQVLHAAATPEVAGLVAAVATEDAWVDPYDALYLGGVAREGEAVEVRTDPVVTVEREPSPFPCDTQGATDGTRDAWFAERDALQHVDALTMPLYVGHVLENGTPIRQSHALVAALLSAVDTDDDVLRVLSQRTESDFWDETEVEVVRGFVRAAIDPVADIREDETRRLQSRGGSYGAPISECTLCLNTSTGGTVGALDRTVAETTYFLNRTFEQDLDCVPVCVPGPGTGEVGTLEEVNRFETPWAPVFTWVDAGADSERLTFNDPLNDGSGNEFGDEALPGGHGYHSLAFRTAPFDDWREILGTVRLEGAFNTGSAGGHVTPLLTAVSEEYGTRLIARGAFDLDFAGGLDRRSHQAGWKTATITFDAIDNGVNEGESLQVILQSNNVGVFETGAAQGTVNVATGPVEGVTAIGTVLHVPFLERRDRGF